LSIYQANLYAQNKVVVTLKGLNAGDTALLRIQKSGESFKFKYIGGTGSDIIHTFDTLSNGKWALKIDATGYYFPPTKVFELTNQNILVESKFVLITLLNSVDYVYKWEDDSSYLGHAQQSYINGQPDFKIINDPIKVPDDFSSINLISISGIALSNKLTSWSSEDAYRLYQMVKMGLCRPLIQVTTASSLPSQ
jgi:hypothetical protein